MRAVGIHTWLLSPHDHSVDMYIHSSSFPPLSSPPLPSPPLQPPPVVALPPTSGTIASVRDPTKACRDPTVQVVKEHCTNQIASLCRHRQLAIATKVHPQHQAAAVVKTLGDYPYRAHTLLCRCVCGSLIRTLFVTNCSNACYSISILFLVLSNLYFLYLICMLCMCSYCK